MTTASKASVAIVTIPNTDIVILVFIKLFSVGQDSLSSCLFTKIEFLGYDQHLSKRCGKDSDNTKY